jgi:hypothetical protein
MMKETTTAKEIQLVQEAVDRLHAAPVEIAALNDRLTAESQRRAALESDGDLNDRAVLTQVGELQVLCLLLTNRISAREAARPALLEALQKVCEAAVTKNLGPRVRALRRRVEESVMGQLRPHYADEDELVRAVQGSKIVSELKMLETECVLRYGLRSEQEALNYGRALIAASAAIDEFEERLSSLS